MSSNEDPSAAPNMQSALTSECRICGSRGQHKAFVAYERMFATNAAFDYFECVGCKSIQISVAPPDLGQHYPKNYYSYANVSAIERPPTHIRKWARQKRSERCMGIPTMSGAIIEALGPDYSKIEWDWLRISGVSPSSKILDVGCGHGLFLRKLQQAGFDYLFGVDPYLAETILGPGLSLINRPLSQISGDFDLIMFHHSLEHTLHPVDELILARERLSRAGRILVRVPVASCAAWAEYGSHWAQLDAPRHLTIPSLEGMKHAANRAGLMIKHVQFDSDAFQFWGSELLRRGLPLTRPDGRPTIREDGHFTEGEMSSFAEQAATLNINHAGDQACFYLGHQ